MNHKTTTRAAFAAVCLAMAAPIVCEFLHTTPGTFAAVCLISALVAIAGAAYLDRQARKAEERAQEAARVADDWARACGLAEMRAEAESERARAAEEAATTNATQAAQMADFASRLADHYHPEAVPDDEEPTPHPSTL